MSIHHKTHHKFKARYICDESPFLEKPDNLARLRKIEPGIHVIPSFRFKPAIDIIHRMYATDSDKVYQSINQTSFLPIEVDGEKGAIIYNIDRLQTIELFHATQEGLANLVQSLGLEVQQELETSYRYGFQC